MKKIKFYWTGFLTGIAGIGPSELKLACPDGWMTGWNQPERVLVALSKDDLRNEWVNGGARWSLVDLKDGRPGDFVIVEEECNVPD